MEELTKWQNKNEVDLSKLKVVGCDGCPTNTGHDHGIIVFLEDYLERPLQHFVCLLHFVELGLKNLFVALDGPTTGDIFFKGELGRLITSDHFHSLPFKDKFEPISFGSFEFPDFSSIERSMYGFRKDQDFLFDLCQVVIAGRFTELYESLKVKSPGYDSHARWLIKGILLLLAYTKQTELSKKAQANLKVLVQFVVQAYAPVMFDIKRRENCTEGPWHFWNFCRRTRFLGGLSKIAQKAVDDCIARNSFFGHHENILLAMLSDHRQDVRDRSLEIIEQVRRTDQAPLNLKKKRKNAKVTRMVRKFMVPGKSLNLKADDYTLLIPAIMDKTISWQFTEPPLTIGLEEFELELFVCPAFRCHNQNVERTIKDVSAVVRVEQNHEKARASVVSRQLQRQIMPRFVSKKDYVINSN